MCWGCVLVMIYDVVYGAEFGIIHFIFRQNVSITSVDFIIPISQHVFEQNCSISYRHGACSDHHSKVVFCTVNRLEVVSLHFCVS